MRNRNSRVLDSGDNLPSFDLKLFSGKTVRIPDYLGTNYTVILFYRGYW